MQSRWNDAEAAGFAGEMGQRVYSSRLIGQEPALVVHGGGNTSLKRRERTVFGRDEDVLYVKGSGSDLATIEARDFAPVRLDLLHDLARLDALTDTEMANALRAATLSAAAPAPSVESILHAVLPYRYVDHTHADAIVAITHAPNGADRIREIYGDSVVLIPYSMPGFRLAKLCATLFPEQAGPNTIGMVLMHHGVFSFGDSARESYERMIEMATHAEAYLQRHNAWSISLPDVKPPPESIRGDLAALRKSLSDIVGNPMIVATHRDPQSMAFARHAELDTLSQQGPATPDHVIRTKRVPLIGRDVIAYRDDYQRYFREHEGRTTRQLTMLDAAPRVLLDPDLGMLAVGRSASDARITEDIYRHTIDIILQATALGGYETMSAGDAFDVEYWELEQAKLHSKSATPPFTGEIALVTGAASGIGRACVDALLAQGAAVAALDINPAVETMIDRPAFLGVTCDVTDEAAIQEALEAAVTRFGGLDMLVLNAGLFPPSARLDAISLANWDRVMRVNLDSNVIILREAYPLLKQAPRSGRVVIIGSKNVPAPGPGQATYSASKAALNQLARVAALEWGPDGIRVNVIHPNAVFDTGLWSDEVIEARAKNYGMTAEQYRTNNVMGVEVTSRDVAGLVVAMCGPSFAKTTGAQVPIDGGNERVI